MERYKKTRTSCRESSTRGSCTVSKGLVLALLVEAIATLEQAVVLFSSDYTHYSTTYRTKPFPWYRILASHRGLGNVRQASALFFGL